MTILMFIFEKFANGGCRIFSTKRGDVPSRRHHGDVVHMNYIDAQPQLGRDFVRAPAKFEVIKNLKFRACLRTALIK